VYRLHLPPPGNWEDFETLCLEVWRDVWGDPAAQKNGRRGQAQAGVDVFGQVGGHGAWRGVQSRSKLTPTAELTIEEVEQATADAERFVPPLEHFTIASTVSRDAVLQVEVRRLSAAREAVGKFGVSLASWDDILDLLAPRPSVVRSLYPDLLVGSSHVSGDATQGIVGIIYPSRAVIPQCDAIFHDARVEAAIVEELRVELRNLTTELALNAFEHGGARVVQVALSADSLLIEDDGGPFDVLEASRAQRARAGLVYVREFMRKRSQVVARYERIDDRNVLFLQADRKWSALDFATACAIITKDRYYAGPILTSHAEFPANCVEYCMQVPFGYFFNASSLFEFMLHLMERIPADARVRIQFTRGNLLASVMRHALTGGWLNAARVVVEESDA
jgi:hypothetical protein